MPIFHDSFDSPCEPSKHQTSQDDAESIPCPPGFPQRRISVARPENTLETQTHYAAQGSTTTSHNEQTSVLNRVELIERIKRGSSKKQQPKVCSTETVSKEQRHLDGVHWTSSSLCSELPKTARPTGSAGSRPGSLDRRTSSPSPRSTASRKPSRPSTPESFRQHASAGIEIERPRSALHSGDFREEKESNSSAGTGSFTSGPVATSPVAPWHHAFPTGAASKRAMSPFPGSNYRTENTCSNSRLRAVSHSSLSSPFVFMPPTSPLVQQSNNTDLDFSSTSSSRQASVSPEMSHRRHTFSPRSFQTFQSTYVPGMASATPVGPLRREDSLPCQAHQPRRSITSFNQAQMHPSPQSPLHPRRPSFSSDASPLHHAPMVGSYEESILRGRMSTAPSRPLNFVARIGVLGRGQCKPNLRCPPHVTIPFPAVFYSYNGGNSRIADNTPSPYVGLIDLENSLPHHEESGDSKRKRRHTVPSPEDGDMAGEAPDPPTLQQNMRRREKNRRRSTSPKAPPGGSYRIPQQGQLQIVIKNPNKTAVKLFLVPYDLSDMEPGQKTFIRQRSYSAGPIIDMPLSSRTNLGTDRPEAALSNSDDPNDRPILRYLVHLHICCPSKGRYFLYKTIRVVFANRVPDDKEKLRHETQLPDPPYSAYKPSRESMASAAGSAAEQLTAEKASRRRSAGLSPSAHMHVGPDHAYAAFPPAALQFTGGYTPPLGRRYEPIPFSLSRTLDVGSQPASRDAMDIDTRSPSTQLAVASRSRGSRGESFQGADNFEKLNKGDLGYGGNAFCGVGRPTEGLLALKLRELDVQPVVDDKSSSET